HSRTAFSSSLKVMDHQMCCRVTLIEGSPNNSTYIRFPENPLNTMGCSKSVVVLIVKLGKKDFSFECHVLDDKNVHRRFVWSNTDEIEGKIHINANCRLRDVFFMEEQDDEFSMYCKYNKSLKS
uniref:CFA20 domain-containing protein n=1 Tax=Denticeps clupeoides TaxID=299321 RepID=A0AAY4DZN9_9TELE